MEGTGLRGRHVVRAPRLIQVCSPWTVPRTSRAPLPRGGGGGQRRQLAGLLPAHPGVGAVHPLHGRIGGYQGPTLLTQYLGIGMGVVVVAGVLIWAPGPPVSGCSGPWDSSLPRSAVGSSASGWRPWDLLVHLPLFRNVIPVRLLVVTFLCAGVLVATVADHVRRSLQPVGPGGRARRLLADAVALAVLAVAVVPPAAYLALDVAADHPAGGDPLLVPGGGPRAWPPSGAARRAGAVRRHPELPPTWQSQTHLVFAMAGGDGPGSTPVASDATPGRGAAGRGVEDRRRPSGHRQWDRRRAGRPRRLGATRVVLPDQPGLPAYDQPFAPVAAAALITAALGEAPTLQARAWVWTSAGRHWRSTHRRGRLPDARVRPASTPRSAASGGTGSSARTPGRRFPDRGTEADACQTNSSLTADGADRIGPPPPMSAPDRRPNSRNGRPAGPSRAGGPAVGDARRLPPRHRRRPDRALRPRVGRRTPGSGARGNVRVGRPLE